MCVCNPNYFFWHASIHLQVSSYPHWGQLGMALLAFSDCHEGLLRAQKQCEGQSYSDRAPGSKDDESFMTGYKH